MGTAGNGRVPSLAAVEVGLLEVRHLAELPLSTTLTLSSPDFAGPIVLTTSRAAAERARAARAIVWAPIEYENAAYAVQELHAAAGLSRARWIRWCAQKQADANWRLHARDALDGNPVLLERLTRVRRARPIAEPRITFARFFRELACELVNVEVEES